MYLIPLDLICLQSLCLHLLLHFFLNLLLLVSFILLTLSFSDFGLGEKCKIKKLKK